MKSLNKKNYKSIVKKLIPFFLKAGKKSIQLAGKKLKIQTKEDGTPVSNGDLEVDAILQKAIKFDNCSDESFHLALSSAIQSEMPSLRKHTNIFSTIITISPSVRVIEMQLKFKNQNQILVAQGSCSLKCL